MIQGELIQTEKKLIKSLQKNREDEEQKIENTVKNPRYFYNYALKHTELKTGIGLLITGDGELIKK